MLRRRSSAMDHPARDWRVRDPSAILRFRRGNSHSSVPSVTAPEASPCARRSVRHRARHRSGHPRARCRWRCAGPRLRCSGIGPCAEHWQSRATCGSTASRPDGASSASTGPALSIGGSSRRGSSTFRTGSAWRPPVKDFGGPHGETWSPPTQATRTYTTPPGEARSKACPSVRVLP